MRNCVAERCRMYLDPGYYVEGGVYMFASLVLTVYFALQLIAERYEGNVGKIKIFWHRVGMARASLGLIRSVDLHGVEGIYSHGQLWRLSRAAIA